MIRGGGGDAPWQYLSLKQRCFDWLSAATAAGYGGYGGGAGGRVGASLQFMLLPQSPSRLYLSLSSPAITASVFSPPPPQYIIRPGGMKIPFFFWRASRGAGVAASVPTSDTQDFAGYCKLTLLSFHFPASEPVAKLRVSHRYGLYHLYGSELGGWKGEGGDVWHIG